MEQSPDDARAAPSASAPNDIDMGIQSSPKRPREPAQGNMVSQRAMPIAPAMLESQPETTECLSSDPAKACQSLAHHTTLTGRCLKSVDTWAPLYEEPQSRSTTIQTAERLRKLVNNAIKEPRSEKTITALGRRSSAGLHKCKLIPVERDAEWLIACSPTLLHVPTSQVKKNSPPPPPQKQTIRHTQ
eukprot:scaffold13315_cov115-Isochrysis_galbana.AAC.1